MSGKTALKRPLVEQALRDKLWDDAIGLLIPILEQHPREAQAWLYLGEALEHNSDPMAAWQCYDRAWLLDPMASWIEAAKARLQSGKNGNPPEWLQKLLVVPSVRVVGAVLAKDESENIQRCLRALKPAVDEILVIDTGSTDNTVALARSEGATIMEARWQDDFSSARNAASDMLGDIGWVLWVDADEFLEEEDVISPRVIAGLLDSITPPVLLRIGQSNHHSRLIDTNYDMTRMYPLGHGIQWSGRIHEQVVSPNGQPAQRGVARIRVHHWGYDRETMMRRGKYDRNIRLLTTMTREQPDNPVPWGFLGRDLLTSGKIKEAIDVLYQAERLASAASWYARTPEVRSALCESLTKAGRIDDAYEVAERATQADPEHPIGWYWLSHLSLLRATRLTQDALTAARKCQSLASQYRGLVSVSPDVIHFYAPLVEADSLKVLGQWEEALRLYEDISRRHPDTEAPKKQIAGLRERAHRILPTK